MNYYTAPGCLESGHILKPFVKEKEFVDEVVRAAMLKTQVGKVMKFDAVLKTVCECLQVPTSAVLSKSRIREVVDARHFVMWIMCRQPSRLTYGKIGKMMNRDHATVLHAKRKVDEVVSVDPLFRRKFNLVITACHVKGLTLTPTCD